MCVQSKEAPFFHIIFHTEGNYLGMKSKQSNLQACGNALCQRQILLTPVIVYLCTRSCSLQGLSRVIQVEACRTGAHSEGYPFCNNFNSAYRIKQKLVVLICQLKLLKPSSYSLINPVFMKPPCFSLFPYILRNISLSFPHFKVNSMP